MSLATLGRKSANTFKKVIFSGIIRMKSLVLLVLISVAVLSACVYWTLYNGFYSRPTMLLNKVGLNWSSLNPGCKSKDLNNYTATDLGKIYHHPSIVHYAKFGNTTLKLNFREYTSVLSVYKFVKPETIIFHTYPKGLSGKYWNKIKKWKDTRIKIHKIPPVEKIGGKKVGPIQHVADYVKLNMVLEHGGIALDFDVVIINGSRLKEEQRLSECVLAGELKYINGGFYSCTKNSLFVAKWLESYNHDYHPNEWIYNISYRPLHLLTDNKTDTCYNVCVDNTVCVDPAWPTRKLWLKKGGVKWRTKIAAHYYVKDNIPHDGEDLLKENFSLAELIKYIHDAQL